MSDAVAVMPRYPQVTRNIRMAHPIISGAVLAEVDRLNETLGDGGVSWCGRRERSPGARPGRGGDAEDAEKLCASIAALVERELG